MWVELENKFVDQLLIKALRCHTTLYSPCKAHVSDSLLLGDMLDRCVSNLLSTTLTLQVLLILKPVSHFEYLSYEKYLKKINGFILWIDSNI